MVNCSLHMTNILKFVPDSITLKNIDKYFYAAFLVKLICRFCFPVRNRIEILIPEKKREKRKRGMEIITLSGNAFPYCE